MTKTFKRLLAVAAAVAAFSGAASAGVYNVLNVNLNDGTTTAIALTDDLRVSFNETHLIATGSLANVSVDRSKIVYFTHSYDANVGVNEIAAGSEASFNGNSISFSNLPAGSVVRVFSIGGALVREAAAEGDYTLSLDELASGNYIVNVNNMSYKINIR